MTRSEASAARDNTFPFGVELAHQVTTELERLLVESGCEDELSLAQIREFLVKPIESFMQRPGKGFRGQLVELGYRLGAKSDKLLVDPATRETWGLCQAALEALHAGSLIVDDVQDGSEQRRGVPSLHLRYGTPLAINAGNFLYFWPMEMIRSLGVEPEIELRLYRAFHRVLVQAHCGQALDIGIDAHVVPRDRIKAVCLETMRLKTGALVALALSVGAILSGADERRLAAIDRFGHRLGMALQMFDDIGNVTSSENLDKRFEDLKGLKPSWLWAIATELEEAEFAHFTEIVRLLAVPAREGEAKEEITRFFQETGLLNRARTRALAWLASALGDLKRELPEHEKTVTELAAIGATIANSYK